MPKSILFDLDGTLTDSGEGIMNCAALALERLGIPIPPRDALRVFVGPPLHDTFRQFGVPEAQVDEAIRIYRGRYVPIGKFEKTPYPGIRELLEKLRAQGNRLYVATSKPEEMAVEVLEHFDLAHFFDHICGASLDRSRIAKDAVISYLLQLHGADGQMVMVGDTVFDVLGAAAHGIHAVGVAWGYGSVEEMKKAGAAAIAVTMDELLSILQAL